jgi:hypothetical protein
MKLGHGIVILAALSVGACASPLEQVVDGRHQARIEAANANRPLANGAADGLGRYIAADHDAEISRVRVGN